MKIIIYTLTYYDSGFVFYVPIYFSFQSKTVENLIKYLLCDNIPAIFNLLLPLKNVTF